MKKIALYTSFVLASLFDVTIFMISTSYIQLAVALLLYIPLAYFAFKLFPRKSYAESPSQSVQPSTQNIQPALQTPQKTDSLDQNISEETERKDVEIFDIEKRAFLKLIGATGISIFISSLFTRRFGNLFDRSEDPGTTKIQNPAGNLIDPAKHHPTDNYKISEVDYGVNTYYGFIDQDEGWFIMKEDLNSGTYRYTKADTNFHDNWNKRENLKYDYFNRIFPKS